MSTDTYARHRDEALAGAMQICCQLQSHAHSALTRVQGGYPSSMTEQLEGLTRANEGFLSMMQAWGVSPRWKLPRPTATSSSTAKSVLMAIPIDGRSIHVVHADGSSTNVVPTYGYSIFAADGSSCVHADLYTGNRI
ncbi:hypothetical protein U9M48_044302 [Paspalum notatum var. saurae]|uniref:Uncharacterized protein n=1 Tax=Paspalum notatum var. saurae TaxID=547442 RepID=A0AAQ3UYV2_PASNO